MNKHKDSILKDDRLVHQILEVLREQKRDHEAKLRNDEKEAEREKAKQKAKDDEAKEKEK